jgi:hypothetical protein
MQRSSIVGVLAMVLAAAAVYPARSALNRQYERHRRVLDTAEIPTIGVARVVSLGHVEWLADVLWINGLLYYGESLTARNPGRYVDRYASVMVALDPRFRQAYLWAAVALVLRTGEVPVEDIRRAAEYLEVALRVFPSDGELHFQLGATLAFELTPRLPRNSEERGPVRAVAAEHLRLASALGAGPEWISLTAATWLTAAGRPDAAIETLRDGLVRVENSGFREHIQRRLVELLRAHPDDDHGLAGMQALEATRRREYPYLPTSLYLFVGPRVGP